MPDGHTLKNLVHESKLIFIVKYSLQNTTELITARKIKRKENTTTKISRGKAKMQVSM